MITESTILKDIHRATTNNVNPSKVCISFKGSPDLKLRLAKEANKLGLTLSELIESLLHDFENVEKFGNTNVNGKVLTEKLEAEINMLKKRIAVYENPKLNSIFSELRGRHISFTDFEGNHIELTVNNLSDAYLLLLHSFKSKKNG